MSKKILKKILKKVDLFCIFSVIVIIVSAFFNKFAAGYVFANGDSYQCIDCAKFAESLKYAWSTSNVGAGNISQPYYFLYVVFSFIQRLIGLGNMSVFYYLLFLTASFFAFRISIKLFFTEKKYNQLLLNSSALLYAFSPMVFYFYAVFNLGHLFLYSLSPLIFSLCFRFLDNEKIDYHYFAYFAITLFIISPAFGNAALFVSIILLLSLFIILVGYLSTKLNIIFIKKIALIYLCVFLISFLAIIPQLPTFFSINNSFVSGASVWNLNTWILWASAKLPDLFLLSPAIQFNIDTFTSLFLVVSAFFFFIALLVLITRRNYEKVNLLFASIILLIIFLSNKGKGFLDPQISANIFSSNIIFSSLKSHDKTTILLPLFVLLLFYNYFRRIKKLGLYIIFLFFYLIFISPFILGKVNKELFGLDFNKNYLASTSSTLVKVPDEYQNLANYINNKKLDFRLSNMPWSVLNSPGWANYPKWKMVGIDITTHLLDKPTISPSNVLVRWFYLQDWNKESNKDSLWIFPLSAILNSKYMVYHKDIDKRFLQQTKDKMNFYQKEGFIHLVSDNEFFTLYEIDRKYYLPHIYLADNVILSDSTNEKNIKSTLLGNGDKSKSVIYFTDQNIDQSSLLSLPKQFEPPIIEVKKINPTKYHLIVHGAETAFPLVFSDSFHSGWKAYIMPAQNVQIQSKDDLTNKAKSYSILQDNEDDQATKDELKEFIEKGLISNLSRSDSPNFISKNFQGTIQNDNLDDGTAFETWFKTPIEEKNHLEANSYANSWIIDVASICKDSKKCYKNSDGTYDFEIVLDFWPQRLLYLGFFISGGAFFGFLIFLIFYWQKNKKIKNVAKNN